MTCLATPIERLSVFPGRMPSSGWAEPGLSSDVRPPSWPLIRIFRSPGSLLRLETTAALPDPAAASELKADLVLATHAHAAPGTRKPSGPGSDQRCTFRRAGHVRRGDAPGVCRRSASSRSTAASGGDGAVCDRNHGQPRDHRGCPDTDRSDMFSPGRHPGLPHRRHPLPPGLRQVAELRDVMLVCINGGYGNMGPAGPPA